MFVVLLLQILLDRKIGCRFSRPRKFPMATARNQMQHKLKISRFRSLGVPTFSPSFPGVSNNRHASWSASPCHQSMTNVILALTEATVYRDSSETDGAQDRTSREFQRRIHQFCFNPGPASVEVGVDRRKNRGHSCLKHGPSQISCRRILTSKSKVIISWSFFQSITGQSKIKGEIHY